MPQTEQEGRIAPVPTKPLFKLPSGSCDCHCHLFGPSSKFPFVTEGGGDTFEASKEALRKAHDIIGVERVVIVQGNSHGTDNSVTLDAISDRPDSYRGVALVDTDITEAELEALHTGGIRGIRYGFPPNFGGPPGRDVFLRMAAKIAPFGWHIVIILTEDDIVNHSDMFADLGVPVVIDHMARINPAGGVEQPAFTAMANLLSTGDYWVKLSGATRIASAPYTDAIPIAAGLIEAAPDRVLWGSDWPHPNPGPDGIPDDGDLVDVMAQYTSDDGMRQKFLVDNPAELYGFGK